MMSESSVPLRIRKTGSELFTDGPQELAAGVLSFWQWSASDLVSNTMRGVLAEYIVALALGIEQGMRREWDAYDLALRRQDQGRGEIGCLRSVVASGEALDHPVRRWRRNERGMLRQISWPRSHVAAQTSTSLPFWPTPIAPRSTRWMPVSGSSSYCQPQRSTPASAASTRSH